MILYKKDYIRFSPLDEHYFSNSFRLKYQSKIDRFLQMIEEVNESHFLFILFATTPVYDDIYHNSSSLRIKNLFE